MSITPFLAGQAFDPEVIHNMSTALESVCASLGLKPRSDPAARLVASTIIDMAQRGVRDVETLRKLTLQYYEVADEAS